MQLSEISEQIIKGRRLTKSDDLDFFKTCDLNELCKNADKIRSHFKHDKIELCSIISGRSGRCGENCKFCAQSIWNKSNCSEYEFLDEKTIIEKALSDEKKGVKRFSIVTAGKALNGSEFNKALNVYRELKKRSKLSLCASFGFLNKEELLQLKEAGVETYHHNIESSENFFPQICTSHSFKMKIQTLYTLKECGLRICSGGIIGMGESIEDRISMALSLSQVKVDSIPLNILTPIKGTPLENQKPLSEEEILRTFAIFRFINPESQIRLAAGRKFFSDSGEKAFLSGADSTITGDFLTTSGTTIEKDIELIKKLNIQESLK